MLDCYLGKLDPTADVLLKLSGDASFLQSLETCVQSEIHRFLMFQCSLEHLIVSIHDQTPKVRTHMPHSEVTQFGISANSAIVITLRTVDPCFA